MRHLKGNLYLSICVFSLVAGNAPGQDSNQKVPSAEPNRKHVEELIAQLRSPNNDPNPDRSPWVKFPKNFDHASQKKVWEARDKLVGLSKSAFPILIEHLNDEGYSCSETYSVLLGLTVGHVCFLIIKNQVDVAGMCYKSRTGSDGQSHVYRGYFSQFSPKGEYFTQQGLNRWWKEHQHQSIKEMQMEVLKWAIDQERQIGFPEKMDEQYYLRPLQLQLNDLTKEGPNQADGNPK